jgi:tRNA(fMet)-specific endonuclease VapC
MGWWQADIRMGATMPEIIEVRYLLETDTTTEYLYGNASVEARLDDVDDTSVGISIVSVAEVLQGWLAAVNRSQAKGKPDICVAYDDLLEAHGDLALFNVLRYSAQAELVFHSFTSAVKRVGANDCRIAATAIAHGLIVVTRNTRDFERIPGVQFEDWTIP